MNHFGLTATERIVLESIERGNTNLSQILVDTQLPLAPLQLLIQTLIIKGIISQQGKSITLNQHISQIIEDEVSSIQSRKWETKEILDSFNKTQDQIKMNKVYLTQKDEVIFKGLLRGIDEFIQKLPKAPSNISTAEHSVIFLGYEKYGSLIQRMIS